MLFRILVSLLAFSSFGWSQASVSITGTVSTQGTVTIGSPAGGANLISIAVTPATASQEVGGSVTFSAQGTYSDGTQADVTTSSLWTVSSGTAASNTKNVFTCNSAGLVGVSATLAGIVGTASLTCVTVQISPGSGTLTAYQSVLFAQQFTGSNGTPPYTFSSSDLPGWLSLTNTGCTTNQVNCNLTGTQASIGSYSFHVKVTDSLGTNVTGAYTVQVVVPTAEDNTYCNSDGTTNVAGTFDGPAHMIQKCVYTAIASTPAVCIAPGCTVPILYVCPSGQKLPDGVTPVAGCNTHAAPYYNTIQAALNAIASCGQQIQIYPRNFSLSGGNVISTQNVYNEILTVPGASCGPLDQSGHGEWNWVTTTEFASLPPPGTRITPAWAGQTSIQGYPDYSGPSVPGIYVPAIQPICANGPGCVALTVGDNSKVSAIPAGWRFIGLELFEQKNASAFPTPGYNGSLITAGCQSQNCPQGASYIIFDRILAHACQDKTDLFCTDTMPVGLNMQDGNYLALIDSYLYGFKTLGDRFGAIGNQVESHGVAGGNVQGNLVDGPIKMVNNMIAATSECFFYGGATSDTGAHPFDIEIRRNDCFKPYTWMVGNPAFVGGKIVDGWVGHAGGAYPPAGTVCTVAPPPSGGTPATCTDTIASGKVSGVTITAPGSGYNLANPSVTVWRYPNVGAPCGTQGGCMAPLPTLTQNTTGGSIPSAHKILVGDVFVHAGDGYISDPQLNSGANAVYATITTAGCTGGGCQVVVPAPPLPTGFSGHSVYSCDATTAACTPTLQTASAACVNITGNCLISVVGTGPASGNEPATIDESILFPQDGIYNVKNMGEFKHGVRGFMEGNLGQNNWVGQSDQGGYCWLFTPKNANNNCPTCEVVDLVVRYNICRNGVNGIQFGAEQATQGGFLPGPAGPASFHDNVFELTDFWITDPSQSGNAAGTGFAITNNNPQPTALGNTKINHNTVLHTDVSGKPLSSFIQLFTSICGQSGKANTNALLNGIQVTNNLAAGGVMNISNKSNGCFQCSTNACGSVNALNSKLTNSSCGPIAAGAYTTNELTGIVLNNSGTCSVPVSGCTVNGDGTGGTCNFSNNKAGGVATVYPSAFGACYTTAHVSWTGCTGAGDIPPSATVLIGGAGNPSPAGPWCHDHNINVTGGFPGEEPMLPDPTAQGDTVNACDSPTGGGNKDVADWPSVQFQNFTFDPTSGLPLTDDLHLSAGSPGHAAGNDGKDIGADYSLVLSKTGCNVQGGVTICPQ